MTYLINPGSSIRKKRHFWLWSGFVAIAVFSLDQGTKSLIESGNGHLSLGWLEIARYTNSGIIGGYLADIHPMIGRVLFASLFGLLLVLSALMLYFLEPKEVPRLRWGIVLYTSGLLGNTWDRIWKGAVTDFIGLFNRSGISAEGFAINLADVAVFSGAVLIFGSLIIDYRKIWFEKNHRQQILVEPRFQWGFACLLGLVALLNGLVISIFTLSFLIVHLGPELSQQFLIGVALLELCFISIVILAGVLLSHRMVGPLQAFRQYIQSILNNETSAKAREFRLRKSDHFKNLETLAEEIRQKLIKPGQNPRE